MDSGFNFFLYNTASFIKGNKTDVNKYVFLLDYLKVYKI